jgi:HEAT repeat protein
MSAPTPLLDFFKRGDVARDVRLLAAQGGLAPRAHEQLALLVLLLEDPDQEIREVADATLNSIPVGSLEAFLARSDVSIGLREFFGDRGIFPAEIPAIEVDEPLIDTSDEPVEQDEDVELLPEGADRDSVMQALGKMTFPQRLKAALKGTKEMRAVLIRDPNKMVSSSVLSSPKLTDSEVEAFARMASVSEDVLRTIGANRAWMKSYKIVVALTKNPKCPVALSMNLMSRLNDRDMAMLSVDRNVPEPLRIAARKKIVAATSKK